MAGKLASDAYANMAIVSVTESAANTLTFKKLESGMGWNEKTAWVISRIEYNAGSQLAANFNGDGDKLDFGLCMSNSITSPSTTDVNVLDQLTIERADYGAAATAIFKLYPILKDFSTLPGGGLLITPNPLYLFARGTGLVAASSVVARIYYTVISLTPDDYLQLLEARRILSS